VTKKAFVTVDGDTVVEDSEDEELVTDSEDGVALPRRKRQMVETKTLIAMEEFAVAEHVVNCAPVGRVGKDVTVPYSTTRVSSTVKEEQESFRDATE
jgi:hypothetical protein